MSLGCVIGKRKSAVASGTPSRGSSDITHNSIEAKSTTSSVEKSATERFERTDRVVAAVHCRFRRLSLHQNGNGAVIGNNVRLSAVPALARTAALTGCKDLNEAKRPGPDVRVLEIRPGGSQSGVIRLTLGACGLCKSLVRNRPRGACKRPRVWPALSDWPGIIYLSQLWGI